MIRLAAQVIAQGLRMRLDRWDRRTLERWVQLLPEEIIESQPWLLIGPCLGIVIRVELGPLWNELHQVEAP